MTDQLQSLAVFQTEFVANELQKVLPRGAVNVNTVQVSEDFARSLIYTDPTRINVFTLPTLESQVQRTFSLTAAKGSVITLPSGEVVEKAFRGIASSQADFISREIRVDKATIALNAIARLSELKEPRNEILTGFVH